LITTIAGTYKDPLGKYIANEYVKNRKTINDVYTYVFRQLKCNRLTAKLDTSDDKLSLLLPRMGFEYKYTDEGYYGTPGNPVDAKVYILTNKNAQKWIK